MSGIINVLIGSAGASLRNKMVAAAFSTDSEGYAAGVAGSLTPNTDIVGRTITSAATPDGGVHFQYTITSATNPGQSTFTNLTLQGPSGHLVLASASATYSYVGTSASWTWVANYIINTGDTILLQAS